MGARRSSGKHEGWDAASSAAEDDEGEVMALISVEPVAFPAGEEARDP